MVEIREITNDIALFIISMILFAQNENKIIDKYKKWKEENLDD